VVLITYISYTKAKLKRWKVSFNSNKNVLKVQQSYRKEIFCGAMLTSIAYLIFKVRGHELLNFEKDAT
jgi:hypothetical protein